VLSNQESLLVDGKRPSAMRCCSHDFQRFSQ
jgi:hypothetical protein